MTLNTGMLKAGLGLAILAGALFLSFAAPGLTKQETGPAVTPVVEIREAARQPFAFWEQFEFKSPNDGPQIVGKHHMVAPDRWVVLNYINLQGCSQPKEDLSVRLWISYDYTKQGLGRGVRALQLITTNLGTFLEPEGVYRHVGGSMPMSIYLQPGAEFWFEVWRSGDGEHHRLVDDAKIANWLSGYTVPAVQFDGNVTPPIVQ
jgi:hypothetical protein